MLLSSEHFGQRAYSVRTRIKTAIMRLIIVFLSIGQRAYSIRTRIKTCPCFSQARILVWVREHIPLEQGLRLSKETGLSKIA